MAVVFPTGVKNFGLDLEDGISYPLAAHINDLRWEVAAIEEELGIDPAGASHDLVTRLNALDVLVAAKLSSAKTRRKTIWLVSPDSTTPPDGGEYVTATNIIIPSMLFDPTIEEKVHFCFDVDVEMAVASAMYFQISYYLTSNGSGAETVKFRIFYNSPAASAGVLSTAGTEITGIDDVSARVIDKRYTLSITLPGGSVSAGDLVCCSLSRDITDDDYAHDVGVINISLQYTTAVEV